MYSLTDRSVSETPAGEHRTVESPARRKDIPPQRRRQILDAARELFAQGGYHGVTVEAIAERVGVSKGNIYWYFKSKQEIFQLLFDDIVEKLFLPLAGALEGEAPAVEKLRALATYTLDAAEKEENVEALHFMWQIGVQPELHKLLPSDYSHWVSPFIEHLTPLFEEMGDANPEGTAQLYLIMLDACWFVGALRPDFYDREAIMAAIEDKFLSPGRRQDA
jgi:AcrR family transcriptional regulator